MRCIETPQAIVSNDNQDSKVPQVHKLHLSHLPSFRREAKLYSQKKNTIKRLEKREQLFYFLLKGSFVWLAERFMLQLRIFSSLTLFMLIIFN